MAKIQTSESITIGALLAFSGGVMDAYSYLCRGKVFANAQTGNMLLFGINVFEGNIRAAASYGAPILAFTFGIVVAEIARRALDSKPGIAGTRLHWRQISVFFEMLILFAVAFIPQSLNLLANSMTSLACGMQVETFRTIRGNGVATTMCIGNLRSGTENFCEFVHEKDFSALKRSLLYFGIIICFVLGAVLGNYAIEFLRERAILVCSAILFVTFLMMFSKSRHIGTHSYL